MAQIGGYSNMSYNAGSTGNKLAISGTTSGAITQIASAITTSYTLIWPAAQAATSGYVLTNDGAGNLSWSPGGGSAVSSLNGLTGAIIIASGSGISLTPSGNTITIAATSSGSQQVDLFTLNGTDISNKSITLSMTPSTPNETILLVAQAPNMFYGVDFTVSTNQLSWSGLALDGILSSGDNLTVSYNT
jgi:hypothetical protein